MADPPRDYDRVELVWPDKRTEVERVRLPFQTIERVNDAGRARDAQAPMLTGATDLPDWWPDGWRNKLIWGDNKYVLASLLDEFAGKVDLIYIDPPFATGDDFTFTATVGSTELQKRPTAIEELAYRDTWGRAGERYYQYLYERLVLAKDLLSNTGSIYVHMDWRMGHYVKLLLDDIFGRERFLNEIVRVYAGGGQSKGFFPRKHDPIFLYTKSESWTFNADQVRVPYDSDYQATVFAGDGTRAPGKTYRPDPRGKIPEDWWHYNRPYGDEITGYNTQKPKALLDRIISVSSNPGDICMDFFAGSGTTVVAAEELGRRWIGADLGRFAIQTTRKRLLDIPECRPFEVLNLGRYERRYWQGIEAGEAVHDYYRFILELFGARPIPGFAHLHGERGGRMVHVGATDAPVTNNELDRTLEECVANGIAEVDVLGWEWEMGLNPAGKDSLAQQYGVGVHLFNIPREVMDKRAVDAGDVHFFELSVVEVDTHVDGRDVEIELAGFLPAVDDYMQQKVGGKVKKWSDWIDYWSVDFDFDGETFVNQWQAYRTRKDPKLALRSDPHHYAEPGERRVVVKVIDIFGNDTTHELAVTVGA